MCCRTTRIYQNFQNAFLYPADVTTFTHFLKFLTKGKPRLHTKQFGNTIKRSSHTDGCKYTQIEVHSCIDTVQKIVERAISFRKI